MFISRSKKEKCTLDENLVIIEALISFDFIVKIPKIQIRLTPRVKFWALRSKYGIKAEQ